MEVSFANQKLQKLCNNASKLRGEYGPKCADKIKRRLDQLRAAECLEDIRNLPGARCHELTADREGQLAVDLEHPKRLIFEPDHEPVPVGKNGGIDWQKVTRVLVIEIVDYH